MPHTRRKLLITFVESFATVCIERGIYFYAEENLQFSEAHNLCLALTFGACYVVGALVSHALAARLTEKRILIGSIAVQAVVHICMGAMISPVMLFVGVGLIGAANGVKWPVIESYVNAGLTPTEAAGIVGKFNLSWAAAVPPGLIASGLLIQWHPLSLFLVAAAINLAAIGLCLPLRQRPLHLPHDHPERPSPELLPRLAALLTASRALLLASYAAIFVLAALMPHILTMLGLAVALAAMAAAAMDLGRLAAFLRMQQWTRWHWRVWPLAASAAVLPVGFLLSLYGGAVWLVVLGQLLFGLACGVIYYAGLYYAMVMKNGSVDAGGAHEGLIGLGFALGPAAVLLGMALLPVYRAAGLGGRTGQVLSELSIIGPVLLLCGLLATVKLIAAGRYRQ